MHLKRCGKRLLVGLILRALVNHDYQATYKDSLYCATIETTPPPSRYESKSTCFQYVSYAEALKQSSMDVSRTGSPESLTNDDCHVQCPNNTNIEYGNGTNSVTGNHTEDTEDRYQLKTSLQNIEPLVNISPRNNLVFLGSPA